MGTPPSGTNEGQEARYRANLQGEVDGAHLYRTLAEVRAEILKIAEIYGRLAAVEDDHAQLWKKQIEALGRRVIEPQGELADGARSLFWRANSGPGLSCR